MSRSFKVRGPMVGRALLLVLATAALAACGSTGPPDTGTLDPESPGEVDRVESVHLRIDEAGITTRFDDDGALVRVPVETLQVGAEATLTVSLTSLDDSAGPSGSATFELEEGTHTIEVRVADYQPPVNQAEMAAQLVRYQASVDATDASGARSLLHTVRLLGVRVWAPQQMDAGAASALRVWVRDLSSGELLSDAEVTIGDTTELTDATGQAEFDVVAPEDEATVQLDIVASYDGTVATAARSISIVAAGAPKLYLSTDKPLYRPGQTIHIRALALAARDLAPLEDTPITLEVLDGKGNKVFKEETSTDEFGIASLTALLAPQVNVGDYTIRAITADLTQALIVKVSEEKLPKYAVDVTFDESWFAPGEPITGVISARYFFGKAVSGAGVVIDTGSGSSARPGSFTGTTDTQGLLPFELPGSTAGASTLVVSVTDTAGFSVEKITEAPIAVPQLIVQLVPEATTVPTDRPWQLYVLTRGPLGGAIAATCTLGDDETPFATNDSGVAAIDVDLNNYVQVACSDDSGLSGSAGVHVSPAWQQAILARSDKAIYVPGETITLDLEVGSGSADDATAEDVDSVFVDLVHRGRIVSSALVDIADGQGTLEVTPDEAIDGVLSFTAYFVRADDIVVTAERLVYVQKPCATVSLETDATEYLPGGEAVLTFQVSDANGDGHPAAIGVTIADEAVFSLAGSTNDPNAVKRYFLLDDAPSDIRGYALAPDPDTIQLLAQAALADEAAPSHSAASGLTVTDLRNQAHQQVSPLFATWAGTLQQDLQQAIDAKTLTGSNAVEVLGALVLHDFWGQPITFDVEVNDDSWSNYLYLTVRSIGPDEIADTHDDLARVQYLYFPADRDYSNSAADASGGSGDPSPGMASGGGADFADEDGDGVMEPAPEGESAEKSNAPKKRDDFPETLYVNPSLITDANGQVEVTLPLADVITTWRVSMTANTSGGLVGGATGGITVFQDFFVDVDLPRKLTQNDQLELPVAVFNFDDVDHDVTVTVANADWFVLGGPASQQVSVAAASSVAVPFALEVLTPGHHAIEIEAIGAAGGDAIVRTVEVTPDGQQLDDAASGPLEGDTTVQIEWPDNAIAGGNDAVVKLMGGPSAQMVDGVDALLAAPRGCFEPMMNSTWINALVLDYLKWTGDSKPDLETRALGNLDSGIQQSITFECTGGGFTWFGDPDPAHSILTAFGLLMFEDIGQHKEVDPGLENRARMMLEGRQEQDGHWASNQGTKNQLIPWDDLRTTCIVAWGLGENGEADPTVMAGGIAWILQELVDTADTYTIAMCANALLTVAPEDPATDSVVADLLSRTSQDPQGLTYWDSDYPGVSNAGGEIAQVETTALVAQALYRIAEPPLVVESAMKFLASKKSADGNFRSTQGTIQAMRAFVAAARLASGDTDADVTVRVGDQVVYETHIDANNREVVHMISLAEWADSDIPVFIDYSGEGKLYYQLSNRHYRPWDPATRRVGPNMDVTVDYAPTSVLVGQAITATIRVENTGGTSVTAGDMPMVEFGIPPGFDPDLSDLDKLVAGDPNVARYELKTDKVLIYLHALGTAPEEWFQLDIPLSPRFPMEITTRPGRVWEFFKPDSVSESLPVVLTVTGT